MSSTLAALLQVAFLITMLAVVHRPLGEYMARVYGGTRHARLERALYRLARVNPDADQGAGAYTAGVLAFSAVSVLFLYLLQRLQAWLPLSNGMDPVPPDGAFNTAISFVTNTNWQWYAGESTMSNLTQMAGLTVQNFVSAAVGMAVAIALVRGFARASSSGLGNFWVDLTRGTFRVLLPLSMLAAVVLVANGVIQNLGDPTVVHTLQSGSRELPSGAVASQEAIKNLGTNGGGPFNANSSHPFENPNGWTNILTVFLLMVIPCSMPVTMGRMVGSIRDGYAVLAAMATIWVGLVLAVYAAELNGSGAAPEAAGAAMEGKETRFGLSASPIFAISTTLTSTGSVNSMHDSYTALGGGGTLLAMLLGEVAPGGVGAGLYGMLILAMLAVFVAGLMVGRTPEYLGKKIGPTQMKLVACYLLSMPALVLLGVGVSVSTDAGLDSRTNHGPHGLSEIVYAFASASNNNGSAFAGLDAATGYYNVLLGFAMLLGRFVPIVLVLALAGSLAGQGVVPRTAGTLRTASPLYVGMLVGVAVVVAGLTFFPTLALGPLAEGL